MRLELTVQLCDVSAEVCGPCLDDQLDEVAGPPQMHTITHLYQTGVEFVSQRLGLCTVLVPTPEPRQNSL